MRVFSRRFLIAATISAALAATGCNNSPSGTGAITVDARVDAALTHLASVDPNAQDLQDKAAGMLIMPLITEAGFGLGGSYGRGALRINNVSVDYYSATAASFGFQIGAQQFAHVLYFMTQDALEGFRNAPGWAVGGDLKVVVMNDGESIAADTTTSFAPIVAVIFGQAGLMAGATLEGTKYSRIIP